MGEVTKYNPGTFCWVDLATTDAPAAKQFYSDLFNWTALDRPAGEGGVYTLLQKNAKNVSAIHASVPQGAFPHWMNYVSVSSVDDSAKKAVSLGGQVMMVPMDVMDAGRMAMIKDPGEAIVGLWESNQHIGAELVNEPNSLCWNELYTTNIEACGKFYTELFGWGTTVQEMESMTYTIFTSGEQQMGGMLKPPEEWGEVPSHWLAYFAVENCENSVQKAKTKNATVQVPPTMIPNIGQFAILQDPQGALFAMIQLADPS